MSRVCCSLSVCRRCAVLFPRNATVAAARLPSTRRGPVGCVECGVWGDGSLSPTWRGRQHDPTIGQQPSNKSRTNRQTFLYNPSHSLKR